MFMLYAIPVGLVLGLLLRGRFTNLAGIRFRWMPVFIAGLFAQLALFSPPVTERVGSLGPPLYVVSTAVVLLAVARNWRITGVPIVVAGAICNLAAIIANGGYMPAGASALASLGRTLGTEYSNSAAVAQPNLELLTDIFAMPPWFPVANIFSVGDVLIGLGVVVIIVTGMRRRAVPMTASIVEPVVAPAGAAPSFGDAAPSRASSVAGPTPHHTFAGSLGAWSRADSVARHPWLQGERATRREDAMTPGEDAPTALAS